MKCKAFYAILAIAIISVIVGISAIIKIHQKKTTTIKVGYLPSIGAAPHFISKNESLYEKAGLEIEATEFQSSNQIYDAVAQGKIDITPDISSVPILINHITDPGKVKIFTTQIQNIDKPFDQIIVTQSSPIQSIENLAGKKIGVFPGSTATAYIKDYLAARNKVDISKTEFVQISPPSQLQALEAGSIDALYAYEPTLSAALVEINARPIGLPIQPSYIEENPNGVGIVSSKFLQANPNLAKKIIEVYDQTYDFLNDHDAETRQILIKELKLNPEVAQKVSFSYHSKSNEIDKDTYKKLVDLFISFGEIKSRPDLSILFYK